MKTQFCEFEESINPLFKMKLECVQQGLLGLSRLSTIKSSTNILFYA